MLEKWLAIINNTTGANAHIIYVDTNAADDTNSGQTLALAKKTIDGVAGALSVTSAGDMIVIMPGTYAETVTVDMAITIIGWDRDTTIIAYDGDGHSLAYSTDDVTLKNVTVKAGTSASNCGVFAINRSRLAFENVYFSTETTNIVNSPFLLTNGTGHNFKDCEVSAFTTGCKMGSGSIENMTFACGGDVNSIVTGIKATGRVVINGGVFSITQIPKYDGNSGNNTRYILYADGADAKITITDSFLDLSLGSADGGDGYCIGTDGDGETVFCNRCVMDVTEDGGGGAVKDLNVATGSTVYLRDCSWAGTYDGEGTVNQYQSVNAVLVGSATPGSLSAAIPDTPTAGSIYERVKSMDELTEASGDGDLAAIKANTIDIDGHAIDAYNSALDAYTSASANTSLINALVAGTVTALKASTGWTAGDTMTLAGSFKVVTAILAGNIRSKEGSDTIKEILDPDDGTTVIAEVTISKTTPYRQLTVL